MIGLEDSGISKEKSFSVFGSENKFDKMAAGAPSVSPQQGTFGR